MPKALAPLIALAVFCVASFAWLRPAQRPREHMPRNAQRARELAPPLRPIAPVPRPARRAHASALQSPELPSVLAASEATPPAPPFDPQDIPAEGAPSIDSPDPVHEPDDRPEHSWRATWRSEQADVEWTQRIQDELQQHAAGTLSGALQITHASCRKTVCLVHVQFEDTLDVEAFQRARHADGFHYELQSFEPSPNEDGTDDSRFRYQLIVKRAS